MKPPPLSPKASLEAKKRGDGGGQDRPSRRRGAGAPKKGRGGAFARALVRAFASFVLSLQRQFSMGGVLRPPH